MIREAPERASALAYGQGPQTPYESDRSLSAAFEAQAARTPDAVAVRGSEEVLRYAELNRRANRLAAHLRSLGVENETRVGVAFERAVELPETLLGILKAGGAYVPLDPAYPAERLRYMIGDCAIRHVVTNGPFGDPSLLDSVVTIDVVRDAATIAACSTELPSVRSGADSLTYIVYTSGSTGRPKGVAVTDRGVMRLVRGANYVTIDRDDAFLHFAPLAFDASTFEIWAPLLNGATLVIPPKETISLAELGRIVETFGVTVLFLTSSLFRLVVDSELTRFSGLRQLFTGGDVVPVAQAQRFLETVPACRLVAVYGPTENTTFSTFYPIPSPQAIAGGVPIGRPISNSTAYVLREGMEPAGFGERGELYVGGDGVARGYVNAPELTAERFVPDPFSAGPFARLYRTGDYATLRPDGVLEFVGRIDHQIKLRGFRVELGEIESAVRSQPGVADAAVSVVTAQSDKSLYAHVVRRPDAQLDERVLRDLLAATLPSHMLPARIAFLEALPLHASGKLDRTELARLANVPAFSQPSFAPARRGAPSVQIVVGQCWREALGGVSEPDPDENFFDAGGDSLRLLALHAALQKQLGIEFPIVDMFAQTTVRKLAAFLRARLA